MPVQRHEARSAQIRSVRLPLALVFLDRGGSLADELGLGDFVEMPLLVGVADAVAQDLVTTCSQPFGDVRAVVVDGRVRLRGNGDVERVKEVEQRARRAAIS